MDVIAAYRDVGSYRGAAAICGTTHKTVKRIIEQHEASSVGAGPVARVHRARNFDEVEDLVAEKVMKTSGRISAKRLLPLARAAGYEGSARNLRRLVAEAKAQWRQGNPRGRRPGVWMPGETLIIDWGTQGGLHVFCAVLAWWLGQEARPRPGLRPVSSRTAVRRRRPNAGAAWCWRQGSWRSWQAALDLERGAALVEDPVDDPEAPACADRVVRAEF